MNIELDEVFVQDESDEALELAAGGAQGGARGGRLLVRTSVGYWVIYC